MDRVCTIERRAGKVCMLFIIYIYIYIIYLLMVSCCPYRGGGGVAYRKGNTNGGRFALFLVVGSDGNGGVWWGVGGG